MSDAVVLAVLVAIPPTIAALGAFVVTLRSNAKADRLVAQGVVQERKLEEVHKATNSAWDKVNLALAEARERIVSLEKYVTKLLEQSPNREKGNE